MLTAPIGAIRAVTIRAANMHFNSWNRRHLAGISKDTCHSTERPVTLCLAAEPGKDAMIILTSLAVFFTFILFHTRSLTLL